MGIVSKKPKRGAPKVRHLGRRKEQIARYYAKTYPARKIRRLLKHNTLAEAQSWANRHMATGVFLTIARELGFDI